MSLIIKLDYSIDSPEERNNLVKEILADLEQNDITPTAQYLESLANYLILGAEKQEKRLAKEKKSILTENRMVTINRRETSFEGLVSQFENGESGIYNIIAEDKNIIFQPKVTITKQDLIDIPLLAQLREGIKFWEEKMKTATGRQAYIIKNTLIQLRKDQYIIKNAYRRPIIPTKIIRSRYSLPIEEKFEGFSEKGYPIFSGVSLTHPEVCSAILCNYSKLRQDSWGNFESDIWFLMEDFDECAEVALRNRPVYERIVECKIDGNSNAEIQSILEKEFQAKHSPEYISSLWRNKIPSLIASAAEDKWLYWYYTHKEPGYFKTCNRCGQTKLGHPKYFTRNNTSKDGLYSICKECRKKKVKEE